MNATLDTTQYLFAATIIIGFVNGIQLAVDRNWKSFAMFLTAVVSGAIFGFLHWFGLPNIEIGLALAISSSGVYKVAQKVGGA